MATQAFWPSYERPLRVSRAEYTNLLKRRNSIDAAIVFQWLNEGYAVLEEA